MPSDLRAALTPLYRWIREQYGCDPGSISIAVGSHRLKLPPVPMWVGANPVEGPDDTVRGPHLPSNFSPSPQTEISRNFPPESVGELTDLQKRILTLLDGGRQTLDAISDHVEYCRSGTHRLGIKPLLAKGLVAKFKGTGRERGYEITPAGQAEIDTED